MNIGGEKLCFSINISTSSSQLCAALRGAVSELYETTSLVVQSQKGEEVYISQKKLPPLILLSLNRMGRVYQNGRNETIIHNMGEGDMYFHDAPVSESNEKKKTQHLTSQPSSI